MYKTFIDGRFDFKPYYKKLSEAKIQINQNQPDFILIPKNGKI